MSRFIIALVVLAAAASTAVAQESSAPYVGRLTGSDVYVRSGPSLNHYEMLKLSRPAEVTVVGQVDGWLKILPPAGAYSLVSKQFVESNGQVGTLTGDNVRVRAGSDLRPGTVSVVQTTLKLGDTVQIIGANEEFYKITPPPGVFAYISAQFVERTDGTPPTETITAIAATQPAVVASTVPTATAPATRPVVSAASVDAARKAFDEAEAAMRTEFAKPVEQRDLAALIARYKAISAPAGSGLQPWIDHRLALLNEAASRMQAINDAARIIEETQARQQAIEAERAKIALLASEIEKPLSYAAQGILSASMLFDGSTGVPRRWTVKDPDTGRIVAFAQCTTGLVDLASLEGNNVGLFGARTYEPRLMLYVIDVERVVVLPGAKPQPAAPAAPAAAEPLPMATEADPAQLPVKAEEYE